MNPCVRVMMLMSFSLSLFHNYDTNVILTMTNRAKSSVSHHFASCSDVLSQFSQSAVFFFPLIWLASQMKLQRNCIVRNCAICRKLPVHVSLSGNDFIIIDKLKGVNSLYTKVKSSAAVASHWRFDLNVSFPFRLYIKQKQLQNRSRVYFLLCIKRCSLKSF